LIGDKKPQSYYRDVVWGDSDLELLAQPEAPEGQREIISKWGWRNELPSWNWSGQEGKTMTVRAYTNCDSVRLYLNGAIVGTERADTSLTATFRLRYATGVLRAEGIKDGQISAIKELRTTGNADKIRLYTEDGKTTVSTDKLVFTRAELIDDEGNPVSTDDREITISVEGNGELIATGNAAPDDMRSFRNPKFKTYRGKALIIIKTDIDGGKIKIKAHSQNLPDTELSLRTE
jgi:beta-galactosidase